MDKNECFHLGYIAKRVGNNGDVLFVLDVDDPKRYAKLETVFVELNNSLIPFFIKKMQIRAADAVATIEGIDSIEKAEQITKSNLYLPLSFLPPLKEKQFYFHEVLGFKVKDKTHGDIGVIEEVLDYPQQVIFQIRNGENEILIPAKEEFIEKIDRTTKQIDICAPEGLIDIYLNKGE